MIMMMFCWWCWWNIYENICCWWILACYWRRLNGVSMYWKTLMLYVMNACIELCCWILTCYWRWRILCIQSLVMIFVKICIVVESYVHAYMTDGDGFYIHIGDSYDVFVASGWRPVRDWYHMHIGVSLSALHLLTWDIIVYVLGDTCGYWWLHNWWMYLVNCKLVELVDDFVMAWIYNCWWILSLINHDA